MAEISQDVYRKIRKIQIHTTQLVDDILAGAWHSAFKGRGMEFEEVREYQTGDDIRSIDWNVTARMNNPFIKVFKEERELTVLLIVDVSASSRFGSQNQLKRELIAEIGAVLAFSAIKNSDKVGIILFSDEIEKFIPPKKGLRHVLRVIRELLAFQPKRLGTNLQNALDFTGNVMRKSSICFLISDFLCELPEHQLSVLAKKHDLIAINVSDPYELEFPQMDLITLRDFETGESRIIDTKDANVQRQFKDKSLERIETVSKTMNKIEAGFVDIRTDIPYLPALKKFFQRRELRY